MKKVAIFTTARSNMTFLIPLIKKTNNEPGIKLLLFVSDAKQKIGKVFENFIS